MRRRTAALTMVAPLALSVMLSGPVTAAPDGAGQRLPTLNGKVGPGFTLTIEQERVPAGKYRFVVKDRSDDHNFHLTGPGVNEKTRVEFIGKKVWKLTLQEGTYHAECDPHSSMNDDLIVTG